VSTIVVYVRHNSKGGMCLFYLKLRVWNELFVGRVRCVYCILLYMYCYDIFKKLSFVSSDDSVHAVHYNIIYFSSYITLYCCASGLQLLDAPSSVRFVNSWNALKINISSLIHPPPLPSTRHIPRRPQKLDWVPPIPWSGQTVAEHIPYGSPCRLYTLVNNSV
jgi:hypothetical protein